MEAGRRPEVVRRKMISDQNSTSCRMRSGIRRILTDSNIKSSLINIYENLGSGIDYVFKHKKNEYHKLLPNLPLVYGNKFFTL